MVDLSIEELVGKMGQSLHGMADLLVSMETGQDRAAFKTELQAWDAAWISSDVLPPVFRHALISAFGALGSAVMVESARRRG